MLLQKFMDVIPSTSSNAHAHHSFFHHTPSTTNSTTGSGSSGVHYHALNNQNSASSSSSSSSLTLVGVAPLISLSFLFDMTTHSSVLEIPPYQSFCEQIYDQCTSSISSSSSYSSGGSDNMNRLSFQTIQISSTLTVQQVLQPLVRLLKLYYTMIITMTSNAI